MFLEFWGQCWSICLSIKEQPQDGLEHSVDEILGNAGAWGWWNKSLKMGAFTWTRRNTVRTRWGASRIVLEDEIVRSEWSINSSPKSIAHYLPSLPLTFTHVQTSGKHARVVSWRMMTLKNFVLSSIAAYVWFHPTSNVTTSCMFNSFFPRMIPNTSSPSKYLHVFSHPFSFIFQN